jgi:hypothetical protein
MHAMTLAPRAARALSSKLDVERTGIRFWSPSPERVHFEVEVHNHGAGWSHPTQLLLQTAPFGAFLPWRPLATIDVPWIEPRHSLVVTKDVPRNASPHAADFSGVIPPRLLAAVGAGGADPAPPGHDARQGMRMLFLLKTMIRCGGRMGELAPDLLTMVGREAPHWAGNVNVLIGDRDVERHMAQSLRMYPGRVNLAMFLLGGSARYAMRLEGDAAAWEHGLYDGASGVSLLEPDGTYLFDGQRGVAPVFFACRPPEWSKRGTAEVHVERLPTGERAVVEFSLDATAVGPGCYSV